MTALKRAFPAAAADQQDLQSSLPATTASEEGLTCEARPEKNDVQHDKAITKAASPEKSPLDETCTPVEDKADMVDITPEQPQWRCKQSSRLRQLAESAPARRLNGSGRLPLVQQPLTHPTAANIQHLHDRLDEQQSQPQDSWQQAGVLGLSLQHLEVKRASKSSSHIASSKAQDDSSSSGSMRRLRAATLIPETCVQACDAVPDTPDCRSVKQSCSTQCPDEDAVSPDSREALHISSPPKQRALADLQQEPSQGQAQSVHVPGVRPHLQGVPFGEQQENSKSQHVSNGSPGKEAGAASASASGHASKTVHGSKYCFDRAVVSASACPSGRWVVFSNFR